MRRHAAAAMKVRATPTQTPDDARRWTASMVEAVPSRLPAPDPVQRLLAEQRRHSTRLRLLLSAAAAVLVLLLAAILLT